MITYYALASGFLTGKYRSADDAGKSARGAGVVSKYLDARGLRILDMLEQVAAGRGATPAQVAIAWQIAKPGITAPIASATSLAQLEQLTAAVRLQLSPAEMAALDHASAYRQTTTAAMGKPAQP